MLVNDYRKNFGVPIDESTEIPYLIKVQVDSYKEFLQYDVPIEKRKNIGMQQVFTANFPIISTNGEVAINFMSYRIDTPNYTSTECKNFGITYAGAICITLEIDSITDGQMQTKLQEVYIGEIPFMTENATFIINGSERIIVSQLHRSPGLFFESTQVGDQKIYTSRIIPVRGAWVDFEVDEKQQIFVTINKRRIHATTFLMCLIDDQVGVNAKTAILDLFFKPLEVVKQGDLWLITENSLDVLNNYRLTMNLVNAESEVVYKIDEIFHRDVARDTKLYLTHESVSKMELYSELYCLDSVVNESCEEPDQKTLESLPQGFSIKLICSKGLYRPIINSLRNGKCNNKQDALVRVYPMIRPNDQIRKNEMQDLVEQSLFSEDKYSLSSVGRLKINQKLNTPEVTTVALRKQEIFLIINKLLLLADEQIASDDPDSLEYRRVRSAGELVKNQFQQSIGKFAKSINEKLVSINADTNVLDLINSRHFIASMREFFGTSPLSQLADQTNLLSELSHKRRLSSFGPGGLSRDRPWIDVRDLHPTHYGRICVVETPEGSATGLVNSLTMFSKVDEYGFINTPYRRVKDRKILDEVVYMSTSDEKDLVIAYYDHAIFEDEHTIKPGLLHCRKNSEQIMTNASDVHLIDTSPKQILSVSSSLIPFIENNDTTRAVYGANMQRQALPLLNPTAPLVGTGIERLIASDSGTCIKASNSGIVDYVSATQIIVRTNTLVDTYYLTKFQKSNDSTLIDQIPRVQVGQKVIAGQIIADSAAVDNGEIALGRNVRIAFHSWKGGNYEDAIIISSRLVPHFSSIGMTRFEISAREIKQGIEKFTRDIPNLNEEFINHLDDRGIISIGARVKAGDVLVGRVTPKGETNLTPDERLLRAIFGDKSIDVKDTSLRVPPGMRGTVVDVRIFTRKGIDKTSRELEIEQSTLDQYLKERELELKSLKSAFLEAAREIVSKHAPNSYCPTWQIKDYLAFDLNIEEYQKLVNLYQEKDAQIHKNHDAKTKQLLQGHVLPVGVLEMIQVFVATEYEIQAGDKVAGRHGNKGIIAKIMSPENMPYTKDGEIVDMLFTSTGVSGRMNIGQILETHLGWASINLGKKINNFLQEIQENEQHIQNLRDFLLKIYDSKRESQMILAKTDQEVRDFASKLTEGVPFACPVFESPNRSRIRELLELADCDPSGKEDLYDGETGLKFPQKVTVGVMYVMQLHHLVEKKEHARSVGPYSIITLQPLGGKAQMGGQRFGEMEVWTLQAYSAAYTTRETLTVKSDYPIGRARIFELISQGYDIFDQRGIPESFCVLLYELRALCLKVDCLSLRDGELVAQDLIGLDNFDALKIAIASPAQIRAWSYGEVQKSETIHYRTSKPHPDGLFSARIFGPIKDYQCLCGKHRGTKRKGIICSKCGTEVTSSRVRRYRMGHIELASPVAHIWFSKVLPSRIAIVLDMSVSNLNRILKFESYVVISTGLSPYAVGHVFLEQDHVEAINLYEDNGFEVQTGPEALENLLKRVDLGLEIDNIRLSLQNANETVRTKLIRRLKILEAFHRNNAKPEHMILRVIPVLPPDLRPLVAIEGGRFASSDLNELYRRIINRNNRLDKLQKLPTPEIIIKNERRMLQEAVDALFDNSRRAQPITNSSNKRVLKSIGDSIKGKQGRFRQNLLGKRVDYSGRSVIIVGPKLKLYQCGLPKTMAIELFKPFVLARLVLRGFAPTIRIAKMLIENGQPEVWEILAEVTKSHVVLINRAPTLHRLGIQAFEPVLIEGRAIQLHPLTCKAFNADFDGDQVGVHVPLSIEAQLESRLLMMSTKCILNPSNGIPIAIPSKDIVLGLYALTCIERGFAREDLVVASTEEAEMALLQNVIRYTTPIKAIINNQMVDTTYGRMKLYSLLPVHPELTFDLVNQTMTSKEIQNLVYLAYITAGEEATAVMLDKVMQAGFEHATLCGATFSYSDLPVPEEKAALIAETEAIVANYYRQFKDGLIREDERHNKITSAWAKCTDEVAEKLMQGLSKQEVGQMMNPVYMIAVSGARGSPLQLRQLAGMRGLIARFDGSVQENAIINSLVEGMTVQEYNLGAQGARKGLADTALKTARSGYLTRIISDTAQDCITNIDDCQTTKSLELKALVKFGNTLLSLGTRAFGRTLAENVYGDDGDLIASMNDIVDLKTAKAIDKYEINTIRVRSPVTCEHTGAGICCKCYGYDLSNLKPVNKYVAVGIIAAQSIGEPGTQLTLRSFHSGGAAQNITSESRITALSGGTVCMSGIKTVLRDGTEIVISRNNMLNLLSRSGRLISAHRIPHGSSVYTKDGQAVNKGDVLAEWDPYLSPIIAEQSGKIIFKDLIPDVSLNEVIDNTTGINRLIVKNSRLSPALILNTGKGEIRYSLLPDDAIMVDNGMDVDLGALLIQRSQNVTKSQDIVGGLSLIADLFEARAPKNAAVLAQRDGIVEIANGKIIVRSELSKQEVNIGSNMKVIVENDDHVQPGDLLTDGRPSVHDLLAIKGSEYMSRYLTDEVQNVFQAQGITISDKHIEIILRQMLGSAMVLTSGDSILLRGDIVRVEELNRINDLIEQSGKQKVEFTTILNGISKAAILEKTSFFAAASFQETAKRLISAAISNEVDCLMGMKETLITGQLIPAGAGGIIRDIHRQSRKEIEKSVLETAAREKIV